MRTTPSRIGLAVTCLGLGMSIPQITEATTEDAGSKTIPQVAKVDDLAGANPYSPGYYQTWRSQYASPKRTSRAARAEKKAVTPEPMILASAAKDAAHHSGSANSTKRKGFFSFLRRPKPEAEPQANAAESAVKKNVEVSKSVPTPVKKETKPSATANIQPAPPAKIIPASAVVEPQVAAEPETKPVVQWEPKGAYQPTTVSMPPNAVMTKQLEGVQSVPILPSATEPVHVAAPMPAGESLQIAPPIPESIESKYRSSYSGWTTKSNAESDAEPEKKAE
ncbi:MAG: hypothetical protein U1D30_01555 [Planctomycetota bacterium]